jgi:hypothetical protein
MGEIPEIQIPEVNVVLDLPEVAIPDVPPVTLELGVPVIDMPSFSPLDFEPEVQPIKPRIPKKPQQPDPIDAVKNIRLPEKPKPVPAAEVEEPKPLVQQVMEAIPTLPQATTVAASSVIGVSAALATPFLLKLIKPTVKKVAKKLQQALGKKPKLESVMERRKFQRSLRK